MKHWLINKIPTWVLVRLVERNFQLRQAGRLPDEWYWADLEMSHRDIVLCPNCFNQIDFAERCPFCYPENPVGVPPWLGKEYNSYGDKDD